MHALWILLLLLVPRIQNSRAQNPVTQVIYFISCWSNPTNERVRMKWKQSVLFFFFFFQSKGTCAKTATLHRAICLGDECSFVWLTVNTARQRSHLEQTFVYEGPSIGMCALHTWHALLKLYFTVIRSRGWGVVSRSQTASLSLTCVFSCLFCVCAPETVNVK